MKNSVFGALNAISSAILADSSGKIFFKTDSRHFQTLNRKMESQSQLYQGQPPVSRICAQIPPLTVTRRRIWSTFCSGRKVSTSKDKKSKPKSQTLWSNVPKCERFTRNLCPALLLIMTSGRDISTSKI